MSTGGYLPSESAQHATKQKNHLKSHLHPDSASFELANALSEPAWPIEDEEERVPGGKTCPTSIKRQS